MSFSKTITITSDTANVVSTGGSTGGGAAAGTRKTRRRGRGRRRGTDKPGVSGRKGYQHRRQRKRNQSAMEPQSVHDTNSVEEAKKTNDGLVRNASTETTNTPTGAKQLPTEIRAWFVSLSPRERMLALGFNDSEVVAVLSQLSTASSSVLPASPEAVRVETAMERTTDRPDIDGECAILVRELTCTPTYGGHVEFNRLMEDSLFRWVNAHTYFLCLWM